MEDFFVTLVSNSSMNIFPNNTTSSFTVHLSEKITLRGQWNVAIAEIHYNYNFFNVTSENNKVILSHAEPDSHSDNSLNKILPSVIREIKTGYYNTIHDLIDSVNYLIKDHLHNDLKLLSIDNTTNRTQVHKENLSDDIDCIHLEGRLSMQLGFEPRQNILLVKSSQHIGNLSFGIPDQMLIYTDIIEPTFIGHEKAYVLKVVNTEAKQLCFGDACYKEYTHMHYMRVQKRDFDTISIDIRDHTGSFMPFQHGVLMVKLHFKQQ